MISEYKTREQKSKFYNSCDWKHIRAEVKKRDNNECQECKRNSLVRIDDANELNQTGTRKKIQLVVVHHIKELEDHPDLALDINNLETLCVDCHNRIHDRVFSKPNKWRDDEKW